MAAGGRITSRSSSSGSSSDTATGPAHKETAGISHGAATEDEHAIKKLDSKVIKLSEPNEEELYKHLSPEEIAIIKRQLDIPQVNINYLSLFRYASFNDKFLVITAALSAIVAGAVLPLMTIVFGQLAGVFQHFMLGMIPRSEFEHTLNKYVL